MCVIDCDDYEDDFPCPACGSWDCEGECQSEDYWLERLREDNREHDSR